MARARNIKPSLFKNEILGVADPMLTILFESLWCLADREGRLEDRPLRIKAETFPYREGIDINGYLTELERLEFIDRYVVDGVAVIQVVNFLKHQNPHKTEKDSELPKKPVETDSCALTVKDTLNNDVKTEAVGLIPDSLNTDSLHTETAEKTTAGSVCKKLHELQISGINPSHPDLLKLLDAGCTEQEIVDMASTVNVKKFAYVLGAVTSAREQASKKTVVKGDFGKKEKAWYITASGIEDKAKELGIDINRPFPAIKVDVFKQMKITGEMVSKAQADADGRRA